MKFHTLRSLFTHAWKERSTKIGAAMIVFGWIYHPEINQLIKRMLESDEAASRLIDFIASVTGTYLIIKRGKNND